MPRGDRGGRPRPPAQRPAPARLLLRRLLLPVHLPGQPGRGAPEHDHAGLGSEEAAAAAGQRQGEPPRSLDPHVAAVLEFAMRRQQLKNLVGTAVAFAVLIGFTLLVILAENLLDVTKAHKAGG